MLKKLLILLCFGASCSALDNVCHAIDKGDIILLKDIMSRTDRIKLESCWTLYKQHAQKAVEQSFQALNKKEISYGATIARVVTATGLSIFAATFVYFLYSSFLEYNWYHIGETDNPIPVQLGNGKVIEVPRDLNKMAEIQDDQILYPCILGSLAGLCAYGAVENLVRIFARSTDQVNRFARALIVQKIVESNFDQKELEKFSHL